jgi:hypothetical protein
MINQKFMVAGNGDLFDTSKANWHKLPPLREKYCYHFREINSVANLKATLRMGEFTDLGGYPLYLITSDGGSLSFESAKQNFKSIVDSIKNQINDGWRVVACDVNYENDELYCDHSGKKIESAYGGD